jgi:cytochrome c oxidase cbb3-type subunit 3
MERQMADRKEIDEVTGVETTGHEWDGIKELNKPLPKWWLYVLYATIVWSFGYWVAYPAWPMISGYTEGLLGFSQRERVAEQIALAREAQSALNTKIRESSFEDIKANPELLQYAMAGGRAAFGDNCSGCHGRGAQGYTGFPNLNDDEWIWGGTIDAIHHTIQHGIRNGGAEARDSQMPRFGLDGILQETEISDTAEFVLALSGQKHDAAAAARGTELYANNCASCHGEKGEGNPDLGAPALNNNIWLYGGSKEDIVKSIVTGRGGVMPGWTERLEEETIKKLAVYVHSLGGGQ